MFPSRWSPVFVVVIFIPVIIAENNNSTSNRRSRDFRFRQLQSQSVPQYPFNYYESSPQSSGGSNSGSSGSSGSGGGYRPFPSSDGSLSGAGIPPGYYGSPSSASGSGAGSSSSSASTSLNDGYLPGPPPPSIYQQYSPGPPPSYYKPGYRPAILSQNENNYQSSSSNSQQQSGQRPPPPPLPPPIYPSGSLGYRPSLSPYGQYYPSYYPPISQQYSPPFSSSEYRPGKPPNYDHYHYYPSGLYGSGASASASATSGNGGASAAAASSLASSPGFNYGPPPPPSGPSGPPPPPSSYPPPQPSSNPSPSGFPPNGPGPSIGPETESIFGWGPPPPPPQPQPPYKPVPEFSYQFSLKPSSFGWETSYNVPCGNYQIQPRVMAHLRLATQAVLPKEPEGSGSQGFPTGNKRRRKRNQHLPLARSFLDPFRLERQLQSYNPYESRPFSQARPTFRPRTCRWNFNAVDGCKLNFKCSWFQLPALFRCDENNLHLTDNTILLDKTFCGNRRPRSDQIFSSHSGKLALTFKSKGAALPAILDCTVLCTPENDDLSEIEFKNTPAPTEVSTSQDPSSSSLPGNQATLLPSFPIIAHQHALVSSASTNKEQIQEQLQSKNSTMVIKNPMSPAKPQLRMGNCRCGVPDSHFAAKTVHGRIVGGNTMMPGESPWTAALVKWNSNRPYCGASLINNRFLLTAAHCVISQARKSFLSGNKTDVFGERIYFDVLLNEHDVSQPNEVAGGTIRAKVDKVIVHPNYDNVTFNYDAALIRLVEPIEFNSWTERKIPLAQIYQMSSNDSGSSASNASSSASGFSTGNNNPFLSRQENNSSSHHRLFHNMFDFHSLKRRKRFLIPEIEARAIPPKPVPICLPERNDERNGRDVGEEEDEENFALVTGWGLVTEGGNPSNEMLKARVQIFNDTTCQDLYKKHNYVITDSMMCAGYINGKIDSCVGDSGSPLATEDKDRFVLTGVVSWGRGCGRKQLPGVYTKVTELRDWIYSEASSNDAVWCE